MINTLFSPLGTSGKNLSFGVKLRPFLWKEKGLAVVQGTDIILKKVEVENEEND